MSYRTTTVLLVILAAVAGYAYFFGSGPNEAKQPGSEIVQVLSLDEGSIDSLEVKDAGSVVQVKRNDDGKWQMIKPQEAEADQSRLTGVVYALAKLPATRVVADKADDLAAYGLDKPVVEVAIGAKGGSAANLLIGSQNPTSTGSYVKRADGETVYLVDMASVSQIRGLVSNPPKAKPTPTPGPTATPTVSG